MANTYTLKIEKMNCIPSSGGQTNVVQSISWTVLGSDGAGNSYTAGGTTSIPTSPLNSNFVPYANLTEANVNSWILADPNYSVITAYIDSKIADLITPAIVSPSLPWVTSPAN